MWSRGAAMTEPWWYYAIFGVVVLVWIGAVTSYWLEGRAEKDKALWDDYQRGVR